jgi:hypothetical protein
MCSIVGDKKTVLSKNLFNFWMISRYGPLLPDKASAIDNPRTNFLNYARSEAEAAFHSVDKPDVRSC